MKLVDYYLYSRASSKRGLQLDCSRSIVACHRCVLKKRLYCTAISHVIQESARCLVLLQSTEQWLALVLEALLCLERTLLELLSPG